MQKYIIGIDEVGRGPLAGPVVVTALLMPGSLRLINSKLGQLKDSKQLTEKQREAWSRFLRHHPDIYFATSRVNPKMIDRINISVAANRAAFRTCERVIKKSGISKKSIRIFLDGGLYLGSKALQGASARTVIKGDEKITVVKAASILAKVHRDRFMVNLAKIYPKYGFDIHKGYGTKVHREAIAAFGPAPVHRLTFLK